MTAWPDDDDDDYRQRFRERSLPVKWLQTLVGNLSKYYVAWPRKWLL